MIKFYKRILYISILFLGIFFSNKTYALSNQPKSIINPLVVKDVPPVANPNTKSVNEDVTLNVLDNSTDDLLSNDFDPDGSSISITKYTIGGVDYAVGTAHLIPLQGTITIRANGSYTFVPVGNYFGAVDQITYTITDGLLFASSTLDITVNSVNDDPIALPDVGTGVEGQTLNVSSINGLLSNDSDVDGNILYVVKFRVFGIPGNQIIGDDFLIPGVGTINISITGRYSFRPVADFTGAVPTITYTILDGPGGEASSTLNITVIAINDVPSFVKGLDQVTYIDFPTQTVVNWATALSKGPANESSQVLDFIVTNDKNTLFSTQPAISANGTLTYKPAPGQYGRATVTVQIHDNGGTANGGVDTSAPQTFSISVKPIGITDNDLTPINTPTTTVVTANDGASGIGTTVIAGPTSPANGVFVVNADNTITYTPNANYIGPDTYTYILRTPDGVDSDPVTVNINVYKAELTLAKDGIYNDFNADGKVNVGDRINYTFAIKNTGTIAVTGINIVDAKLTAITGGPITSLAVGVTNSTAITGYYVITQADIDNSGVYNTATATGKDPKNNDVIIVSTDPTPLNASDPNYPITAPTPACPTCTITPLVQSPSLVLFKDGTYADTNSDGKVNTGDRINYTFNIVNTGNVTLTNIMVTDNNAVVNGATLASLAPGANNNSLFTAYHILTQADIDNAGVFNLATATGKSPKLTDVTVTSIDPTPLLVGDATYPILPPTPACPACTVTPLTQTTGLTLLKDGIYADTNADGKVNVGDRINYTFTLANTGNVTLTNVTVTDPNAVIVGVPIVSFAVGAVNNSTFTGYHVLTQADIDNAGVFNLATATAKSPRNTNVTITSTDPTPLVATSPLYPINAPVPACPTCTVTPVAQTVSLNLLKDGVYNDFNADGKVNVGDRIVYSFTVINSGNTTLTNVNVTDPNAIMSGSALATFAPGVSNSTTFTGYHTITQAEIDNRGVFNLATATAKDTKNNTISIVSNDPTPLLSTSPQYPLVAPVPSCSTCTVTPITQSAAIALVKTVTNTGTGAGGVFILGNVIQYTFNITNTGNVTLTNLALTDAKLATGAISVGVNLAPGASTTLIRIYVITAADVAAGSVTNSATVTATTPAGTVVTDLSGSLLTNDVPTVTPVSKPLVAVNDVISTRQGELVNIAIQANDIQGSTAIVPTSVVITVAPLHGIAVINNNGSVDYKPVLGYIGTDVFSYTIKDLSGQTSNVATVTINVSLSNPKAIDDKITTTYNKLVTIPIILNDVKDGVDFDLTSIQIVSQPTRGTVKINSDGSVTYTPKQNETGIDTFTYRIKDLNGNFTNTATVTISIEGLLFGNVITPNGDGKNDFWVIVGANTYDKVEVEIYNRYGNQVYMSKAYKNDWNGANLNEGTYYYTAILYRGGVATTVKGWVLIKR
jgi:gliding motility-associated-like protein